MNKESALYAVIEKEYPEVDYGKGMYIYDKQGKRYLDCACLLYTSLCSFL